jgi:hypothetical protein
MRARPDFAFNRRTWTTRARALRGSVRCTTRFPRVAGVPVEFVLFAAVLAGVALLHHHSLRVALIGVATITLYKLAFSSFHGGTGVAGSRRTCERVGAARQPAAADRRLRAARAPLRGEPRPDPAAALLADDWKGGFALLVIVFVLSSFLDNIAAAMIGGAMAHAPVPRSRPRRLSSPRSSPRRTPAARAASSATRRRR